MFTGIVTDIGTIENVEKLDHGLRIKITTHYDADSIDLGASIACSGICLTVVERAKSGANHNWFIVEAWEEALRLTTIKNWAINDNINLERSLKLGDEMGGHLVSGHVDGLAKVLSRENEGEAVRFRLSVPEALAPYIAQKGSVGLNGTSLTVNSVEDNIFDVLIIRHTSEVTTWANTQPGDEVNIEIDQLARYAARLANYRDLSKVD